MLCKYDLKKTFFPIQNILYRDMITINTFTHISPLAVNDLLAIALEQSGRAEVDDLVHVPQILLNDLMTLKYWEGSCRT